MGFREGAYARVWSAEKGKGNYSVCNLNISKKDKETNEYNIDFQDGYVKFIGDAHKLISSIDIPEKGGVSIKITSCEVTNKYDKEKKKIYTNFIIYGFEFPDSNDNNKSSSKATKEKGIINEPTSDEDYELPFE